MTAYKPVLLGPLPVDAINATLGTELDPGAVYLSGKARQHSAEDHPADYPLVIPVSGGRGYALVAVGLEVDERGRYRVRSGYVPEEAKVESRRRAGRLRLLKRQGPPEGGPAMAERVAKRDLLGL